MAKKIVIWVVAAVIFLAFTGCNVKSLSGKQRNSITIKLMIGRDKQWIFDEVQNILNKSNVKINNKSIYIITDKAGTGEAMEKILRPESDYMGWMPASSTYIQWANEQWYKRGNVKPRVNEEATTVFLTPTVIAMKESLARRMGYPQKKIGWEDILNLSVSKEGWGIYGEPSLNPVRFSHTHPAKSNSGLNTLIAEEYAFSGKTRALTIEDIKRNSSKLQAVEQTIVHYGESTSLLQKKIVEKGPQFIQYAVLYEYMVADMNKNSMDGEKTIALYPKEGTIWGDVSFTDVYSGNVSEEQRLALKKIKEILLSKNIQSKGMNEFFFRPANTNIPLSEAISTARGVDPAEPKTTLELPNLEVINAILEDWQKNMKKRANVTLVIDTSESMRGEAIDSVKTALQNIMSTDMQRNDYTGLNSEDYISLLDFNSEIGDVLTVKGNEAYKIDSKIDELQVKDATRLYDAIEAGIESNKRIARLEEDKNKRIHIMIVLTDGMDTDSKIKYEQLINDLDTQQGNLPVIITVGYGNVDEIKLTEIAEKTGGKYYKGTPATIRQLFEEIKTYF